MYSGCTHAGSWGSRVPVESRPALGVACRRSLPGGGLGPEGGGGAPRRLSQAPPELLHLPRPLPLGGLQVCLTGGCPAPPMGATPPHAGPAPQGAGNPKGTRKTSRTKRVWDVDSEPSAACARVQGAGGPGAPSRPLPRAPGGSQEPAGRQAGDTPSSRLSSPPWLPAPLNPGLLPESALGSTPSAPAAGPSPGFLPRRLRAQIGLCVSSIAGGSARTRLGSRARGSMSRRGLCSGSPRPGAPHRGWEGSRLLGAEAGPAATELRSPCPCWLSDGVALGSRVPPGLLTARSPPPLKLARARPPYSLSLSDYPSAMSQSTLCF